MRSLDWRQCLVVAVPLSLLLVMVGIIEVGLTLRNSDVDGSR
jgi:hypothetical protein